jgi:hypothetical protein
MKSIIIPAWVTFAGGLVVGACLALLPGIRYGITPLSNQSAVQFDKLTGRAWLIYQGFRVKLTDASITKPGRDSTAKNDIPDEKTMFPDTK